MKYQEWRGIHDRSRWGSGQWDHEPDKIQWLDEATKLPCLALRNRMGSWCGYVGVPPGHPLYGQDYDAAYEIATKMNCNIDVHGGLTFADKCQEEDKEHGICHVVEPDEDDDIWWLGFDCAHGGDLVPSMRFLESKMGFPPFLVDKQEYEKYRDTEYVIGETTKLARQLDAFNTGPTSQGTNVNVSKSS